MFVYKLMCYTSCSNIRKRFVINLYLICAEIIVSCPDIVVAVGTVLVRVTIKIRIPITIRIVCNVNIVSPSKSWTIVIITVCRIFIIGINVVFKVSISIIVLQRVYEAVRRVLISSRPWNKTSLVSILEMYGYLLLRSLHRPHLKPWKCHKRLNNMALE